MPSLQNRIQSQFHPYKYRRRQTREVLVGSVGVGGTNPLRVQSMTITSTMDTKATVDQTKKLVSVGCEIVRITAPTIKEARNLENIKNDLLKSGCEVPLAADIHFNPAAAMDAADFVEKVRINPGNFVDGKMFRVREYTDDQYESELNRLEDRFTPLVEKLKRLKRAIRIGTNHGSLSDRIMNRYGDTPLGMVESALEFARICRKNDYHDIIFSMKASNPRVMVAAYRMLADRLDEEGWDYPFHLGVTEAGDGEDGRIKSAVGIGSLLEDGIGDTIRVSLTEDPEYEIPVAQSLANHYRPVDVRQRVEAVNVSTDAKENYVSSRTEFNRRQTHLVRSGPIELGGSSPLRVISHLNLQSNSSTDLMALMEERVKTDTLPEILVIPYTRENFKSSFSSFTKEMKKETSRLSFWVSMEAGSVPTDLSFDADGLVYSFDETSKTDDVNKLIEVCQKNRTLLVLRGSKPSVLIQAAQAALSKSVNVVLGLSEKAGLNFVQSSRALFVALKKAELDCPVVLWGFEPTPGLPTAAVQGSLICDGLGDAVNVSASPLDSDELNFAYNLLQASGSRLTKTEFVSCPSCGRTLFDLQTTTERIKSKTGHLKGVKIAIMGCIVNGPGEMADADFGYVGGGPGKINLYVGKSCVEKSIPSAVADEKLIDLIKSHGKWVDPA